MKKRSLILLSSALVIAGVIGLGFWQSVLATVPGTNTLISYNSTNTGPSSGGATIVAHTSEDGNVIAWTSAATDVISGYSASNSIYVRNMQTGATVAANIDLSGVGAWINNTQFAISRTGRYVVFSSNSSNLVTTPVVTTGAGYYHVYLRDTLLGITTLIDQSSAGVVAVGYGTGTAQPWPTAVSDDGRFVTFGSAATNLLSSNNPSSPNYTWYYYIKDVQTGQVINPLVSNSAVRSNAPSGAVVTSCDAAFATFGAGATNLTVNDNSNTNTYLVDMRSGYKITNLTYNLNQGAFPVSISCNGRYIVLYSTSTNVTADTVSGMVGHLFRYDRLTDAYTLIDKSTAGYISSTYTPDDLPVGSRSVSDNGLVVFGHRDHALVSPAVAKDWEQYLRNPEAGTTELIPINSSGVEQNATVIRNSLEITARGDYVVYSSKATNLVPGVTSGVTSVVRSKTQ